MMVEESKTRPIPKVHPFDRRTIRRITGDPSFTVSRATIRRCETCAKLPEHLSLDGNLHLPEAAANLARKVDIREGLGLMRCGTCGCFYKLEARSEFLRGGAPEGWYLMRLQPGDAFEFLLGQEATAFLQEGDRWYLMR